MEKTTQSVGNRPTEKSPTSQKAVFREKEDISIVGKKEGTSIASTGLNSS